MQAQLYVNGRAGLLSPAGIRTYRQLGVVVARGLLPESLVAALARACRDVAEARGARVFPGVDEEHNGRIDFDARMEPKPTANLGAQAPPPEIQAQLRRQDEARALERRYRKVLLKCRNTREVDRVYARLAAVRAKYMRFKYVKNCVGEEEERAGRMSDARMRELGGEHTYEDVRASFERYRGSGKMEMEVRREYHLDRALEHLQNWSKCWCRVWPDSPALQRLLLPGADGALGTAVGEAAAALAGDVVVRLFDDAVHDYHPFLNSTPFHFVGSATNFRSRSGMTVSVGLAAGQAPALVIPGSHHVMREFTDDGRDFSRYRAGGVFDMGRAIRNIAPLRELPVVQLEPLEPGSVVFTNHYTLSAVQPTMCGGAANYTPPSARTVNCPYQYSMTLMPDRCVFDGLRNSWASRDSHGPLHSYKPGQPLVDDAVFPVIHRALDVE
ncbi:putative 40S ribosomal protein S8 [Trypanosoma conorhini]|uniref:Putative 40S ribosomal protein S8 n=1 Tax=Trypanosoma conorhini TaxID=83891 RepID=A0A3S5IT26_9TRYP|nr:putative 40S ribosomal protein S8 [Trypanosoma conorhini]RNF16505.1 putative 40S ribosomal protein S8 [Trypanosoma conorhini]